MTPSKASSNHPNPGVRASEIANFLGRPLSGADILIEGPSSAGSPSKGTMVFIKSDSDALIDAVNSTGDLLVLALPASTAKLTTSYVETDNPRLAFAEAVWHFFAPSTVAVVAETARIAASAQVGEGVSIGEYSVLGDGVVVGAGTTIGTHVSITGRARLGRECVIKSHAAIGEEGFGFEVDAHGHPILLPHLGSVIIGDHVGVGSFTTVVRGTIGDTVIRDWAKIDDHVHIAHNVDIGEGAFVIANAEVSGSVKVGAGAWIAPQASTLNGISVGERAQIGLGAVVTKDVAPNTVVAGNPARVLRTRRP